MELQLSYDPQTRHKTGAAFLRGNSPEQWFREMSDWQIPLKGLACFLLPEHKSTIAPGGLLIIFNDQVPADGKISHPYSVISENLFIPVNAKLMPALSPAEMKELLIWDIQVFHPAIGFVGFHEDDKLPLSRFLSAGQAITKSWDHAHPGMPPLVPLQSISVDMPVTVDLAGLLNDGERASIRPLSELPGKKPRKTMLMHILDWLVKLLLLVVLAITSIIFRIWPPRPLQPAPASNTGTSASGAAQGGKPASVKNGGLVEKLRQWLEKTIQDIDERRESELNRLLKMFDSDEDEALKYAIPIGGNASAGRGTAPQSGTLTKQETNFSLGKLHSSNPVDTWSATDDFSQLLSDKYKHQAQRALHKGDHRKAAYIYAHLLGDLHTAASVLEQGQFYHEAAALYQNNLKLPVKAAECFEKGGLLLDAINIYKALEKYEKTGDLYKQLSQNKAAQQYFQLATDVAIQQRNYLEAARILQDKSGKPEEAEEVLLQGWHYDNRATTCLTQYFQLAKELDENSLPGKIRNVYEHETPDHKKDNLIEVLFNVRTQLNTAAQNTTTEVIYEIISPQVAAGNKHKLTILKRLMPDDKELPADIYRYTNPQKEAKQENPDTSLNISFQLDQHIQWLAATVIKKQLLFVGTSDNKLYVLRMTTQGVQKYYSWQIPPIPEKNGQKEQFSASFSENDTTKYECKLLHLVSASRRLHLGKLALRSEKPFGGKVIIDIPDYPASHMAGMIGMTINSREEPVMIFTDRETGETFIRTSSGTSYVLFDGTRIHVQIPDRPIPVLGEGIYYFFQGKTIYLVGSTGRTSRTELSGEIKCLTGIDTPRGLLMMAATTKGCVLILNHRDDIHMQEIAEDIFVREGRFISDKYLVISAHHYSTVTVYDVTTITPVVKTHITTAAPVSFILPTGNPGEVALLDEKGRISVHQLD
jgi:tetratricopeptide (TPR) repeat protein